MKIIYFLYFFVIYLLSFVSYSILFPYFIPNITIAYVLGALSYGLLLPVVVIILSSLLSLAVLYKNVAKILFATFLTFVSLMLYGSVGYYLFFLRADKLFLIGGILCLVLLFSFFIRLILNASISEFLRRIILTTIFIAILVMFGIITAKSNTATASSCASLQGTEAEICNRSFAIKDNNLDLCMTQSKFSDGKAYCLYDVLYNLYSQNKLTEATCEILKNQDARSVCFNRLAFLEGEDGYCSEVKEWYEDSSVLIYHPPFGGGDSRSNLLTRDGCYVNSALKKSNSNSCLLIKDEFLQYGCLVETNSPLADENYKNFIESLRNEKFLRGDKGYEEWKRSQQPFKF